MGQVVNHLIKSKRHPKAAFRNVVEATQITRPRLHAIHREMHDKVDNRKPPEPRLKTTDDDQSQKRMDRTVRRQRRNETPIRAFLLQHVAILQREIRDEVFQLKHDEQNENQSDRFHRC